MTSNRRATGAIRLPGAINPSTISYLAFEPECVAEDPFGRGGKVLTSDGLILPSRHPVHASPAPTSARRHPV